MEQQRVAWNIMMERGSIRRNIVREMMGTRSYDAYGYYAYVLHMYVEYTHGRAHAVLIVHVFLLSEYLLYA